MARPATLSHLLDARLSEQSVGPDRERDLALSRGCEPVSLGPRVLRTETAALAALSAIHALWGDFR